MVASRVSRAPETETQAPPSPHEHRPGWALWRRFAALLAVPLALLGQALWNGDALLPHLPVQLHPLAMEYPEAAAAAELGTNYSTSDRIFAALTDQYAIREEIARGSLPTWEPNFGLGQPLFSGAIAGPAYPLNWLNWVFAPELLAAWLAALSLVLVGLGMWLFLERRGHGDAAALVGALAVQTGGWGLANLEYFMKFDAALWLPFQLWAIEGVLQGKRRAGPWLAIFTGLSILAGFPPIALFALTAAALYTLGRAAARRCPKGLATIGLYLAVGIALSLWQTLPTVENSISSLRQDTTFEQLRSASLPLASWLGVFVPHLFGSPLEAIFAGQDAAVWWLTSASKAEAALGANSLEWNTYAGILTSILVAVALIARPRHCVLPGALLLAVFGFVQGWPVIRLVYHLPGFDISAPNRALGVAWILWPWLASIGAGALFDGDARARRAALALSVAAAVAGAAFWFTTDAASWSASFEETLVARYGNTVEDLRAVVSQEHSLAAGERLRQSALTIAATSLAAAFALLLATRAAGARRLIAAVAVALVAAAPLAGVISAETGQSTPIASLVGLACLAAAAPPAAPLLLSTLLVVEGVHTGAPHVVARPLSGLDVFPESDALDRLAELTGDGRVLRLDTTPGVVRDAEWLARSNLLQPYGIGDLSNWTIFTPLPLAELMLALHPQTIFMRQLARLPDPALLGHHALDHLRVTTILSRHPVEHPRLQAAWSLPELHAYRRAGALPPARVVPTAVRVAPEATLETFLIGMVDPARQVILERDVPTAPALAGAFEPGTVTVARPAKNRFDVQVTGSSGGWLVMQEQWFPGWKCNVNGRDAELVRADHTFRAVWIPPGDSLVRTWYEPWSLRIGAAISLMALVFCLVQFRARSPEPL